jgi:adenylylsulfate kinase
VNARPCVVWLTGLSGAGKTTLAKALRVALGNSGCPVAVIDGDVLRRGLSRDLGYGATDRAENVRRAAEVARLMMDSGQTVIVAMMSPSRAARAEARALFQPGRFVEVYVDLPIIVAEARDPKGIYRAMRRGELRDVPGIDMAYEPPELPEVHVHVVQDDIATSVATVLGALARAGEQGRGDVS